MKYCTLCGLLMSAYDNEEEFDENKDYGETIYDPNKYRCSCGNTDAVNELQWLIEKINDMDERVKALEK